MSPLKDQGGYAVANNYGECLCMCVWILLRGLNKLNEQKSSFQAH